MYGSTVWEYRYPQLENKTARGSHKTFAKDPLESPLEIPTEDKFRKKDRD
jgi:hypothetical protein